jgi:CHAD domain-containing protein
MITIDLSQSNIASLPPPQAVPLLPERIPVSNSRSPALPSTATTPRNETPRQRARSERVSPLIGWHVPPDAGARIAASLHDQWSVYRKQLRQCQKNFSETSVHQLRVATRRLMTRVDLVNCLISNDRAQRARRKLKQRLKLMGELRDVQVQMGFVKQHTEAFPALVVVLDALERRERLLANAVRSRVLGMRTGKLEKWIEACCDELTSSPAAHRGRQPVAARALISLTAAFETVKARRQAVDPANSETLHRTRVAFKKFRYMVEGLSPAFTGLGKAGLRRFANYQKRMGNLQDLEVLQASVAGFLLLHPGTGDALKGFCRYLATRRRRALRSCLAHVDDLFALYNPAELEQLPPLARTAA